MKLELCKRVIITLFILIAAGILLAFNGFPFLHYLISNEEIYETVIPITLTGKTVFISDLHLMESSTKESGNFPVNLPRDTKNLIIVGDLFDSPEFFNKLAGNEKDLSKPFCTALNFINNSPENVYLVVGTHEPEFLSYPEFLGYEINCNNSKVHISGRLAIFEIDGMTFAAHHGDYIANGIVGCAVSYVSKKLGKPLLLERLWRNGIGLDENYWLITGHTHITAADYEHKNANPGAWNHVPVIGGDLKNIIIFENGRVMLVKLS